MEILHLFSKKKKRKKERVKCAIKLLLVFYVVVYLTPSLLPASSSWNLTQPSTKVLLLVCHFLSGLEHTCLQWSSKIT
jgi:hypothetical protein